MNPNPSAMRILCYGDSNTWGRSGASTERYALNERWPCVLQTLLGDHYEVIEERLRSRTTNLDDDDPEFPGRNGLTYLRPCIESHNPLHLIILWLGTNDLKSKFNRQPIDVINGLRLLFDVIEHSARQPNGKVSHVLLAVPPCIDGSYIKPDSQFAGAAKKSQEFPSLYEALSKERDCMLIDLSFVNPGKDDGIHLNKNEHRIVSKLIYEKVVKIFK